VGGIRIIIARAVIFARGKESVLFGKYKSLFEINIVQQATTLRWLESGHRR